MRPGAAGLYVAAPIWNEFMQKVYEIMDDEQRTADNNNQFILPSEVEEFIEPEPISTTTKPMLNGQLAFEDKVKIDKISGKQATELTPPDLIEEKSYYQVHSILYYVDKNNPLENYPEEPTRDTQFENWEKPVLDWARNQPCSQGICYNQNPPSQYDDVHTPENQPEIKITSPQAGDLIIKTNLTIKAKAEASLGIKQVDFFLNDKLIGADNTAPYSINFNLLPYLNTSTTFQIIKVRAYDQVLNRQEDKINIRINY